MLSVVCCCVLLCVVCGCCVVVVLVVVVLVVVVSEFDVKVCMSTSRTHASPQCLHGKQPQVIETNLARDCHGPKKSSLAAVECANPNSAGTTRTANK